MLQISVLQFYKYWPRNMLHEKERQKNGRARGIVRLQEHVKAKRTRKDMQILTEQKYDNIMNCWFVMFEFLILRRSREDRCFVCYCFNEL